MCIGIPKAPKIPAPLPVPDRRASVLPDGGDPTIALEARKRRSLMPSLMVFSNQSTLGAPKIGSATTNSLGN